MGLLKLTLFCATIGSWSKAIPWNHGATPEAKVFNSRKLICANLTKLPQSLLGDRQRSTTRWDDSDELELQEKSLNENQNGCHDATM